MYKSGTKSKEAVQKIHWREKRLKYEINIKNAKLKSKKQEK